ncbi:hypothetical protein BS614_20235 [Paenibacillus xylanexedens]|uniref:hypothetical protein n=1 Tax=Paenibacillus xylanexedens TaxID=528191 RepID=UPI0009380B3E|nr:hypothetical protein BS614_20235 [Paenibacillus xylanexedens]
MFPVTQQLYHFVMHEEEIEPIVSKLPITEVSWMDAIAFCNRAKQDQRDIGMQELIKLHGIKEIPMDLFIK